MFQALDNLKKNEVYLCTGGSPGYATWGELMSTRARQLGAAGAVLNGYSRDTRGILRLGFPTFSIGRYAQDQRPRGRVVGYRTTVQIGQTTVEPGDLVFGDLDGVLVIPQSIEQEVLRAAMEKVKREELVRVAFERDNMTASDAVAKFGVM
jgi:regulator of RNase E activity RraA